MNPPPVTTLSNSEPQGSVIASVTESTLPTTTTTISNTNTESSNFVEDHPTTTISNILIPVPGPDIPIPEPYHYSEQDLPEPDPLRQSFGNRIKRDNNSTTQLLGDFIKKSYNLKFSLVTHNRTKRSGFWTKIFGVATSDDLVEAYKNEVDIGLREDHVERTVSDITKKTNSLITNYKQMTVDLERVELQERNLFNYIDKIVRAETESVRKLETLSKSLDRLTVMNTEFQNINIQTMLLIHTIEKLHVLVQIGLMGLVDVAQLPVELIQMYSPNNMKAAIKVTNVEFIFSNEGYFIRLRIPTLSEPYIMYNIVSIPLYLQNHWSTLLLKNSIIMNSVMDTLEPSAPLPSICDQRDSYFVCNPLDVVIRHTLSTCEMDIAKSIQSLKPVFPNCKFDHVKLNANSQYALVVRGQISISSMINDNLSYICEDSSQSSTLPIPIGFSVHNLREKCIYETGSLTLYNSPKSYLMDKYQDTDTELNIISALGSLDSLLDESILGDYSNTTSIEAIVKSYEKAQIDTDITYKKLMDDIRIAQSVKNLEDFSPIKLNIKNPTHQNNYVAGITWIVILISMVVIIIIICVICPGCFPAIFASLVYCCTGFFRGMSACGVACCKTLGPADPETQEPQPVDEVELLLKAPLSQPFTPMTDPRITNILNVPSDAPPRYPNLESNYETTKPWHEWRITKGRYNEYLITTTVPDGAGHLAVIFYDIPDGLAIDQLNRPLPYINPPSSDLICQFQEKVRKSSPPNFMSNDGLLYLPDAPHIIFSNDIDRWINRATKRVISGLNTPIQPDYRFNPILPNLVPGP